MGGVLGLFGRRPVDPPAPLSVLQLQTAKEILGEVFDAPQADVEEMIRQRIIEIQAMSGWPKESY